MQNKKLSTAAALTAVAALAVAGGTLAAFTDSDTTETQILKAGTVDVNIVEDANWAENLGNLAIGDTAARGLTLDNNSTLAIKSIKLTADYADTVGEFGGKLSEAVTVDIMQGSNVLANDVAIEDLDQYEVVFGGDLAAATDLDLDFVYTVVGAPAAETGDRFTGARESASNPDNKYQGSSLDISYTIDAIQRDGIAQ